jgi:ABC-type transport system involved in cytochrome c biogenesis permease subunit
VDRGRIIESRKDNLIMAISGKPGCVLGTMVYITPDDYQQGAKVKIMFIHVPAAWLGMFAWGLMSAAALGTLVWRHPLADVAAKTAALR